MIVIKESGLSFGPFPDADCLNLEKSTTFARMQNVMMCEFALLRKPPNKPTSVWLVEAKQSSPKPQTQPNFATFIDEIRQKLSNSLQLLMALHLGRHPEPLPAGFQQLSMREDIRLVLVINGHEKQWLPPLQEALQATLRPLVRSFGLDGNAVVVINHEHAKGYGLAVLEEDA